MPDNKELLKRITARPDVFGGKPIIRDMRISVELVLSLLSQGVTPEAIPGRLSQIGTGRYSRLHRIRSCSNRGRFPGRRGNWITDNAIV